MTYLRPFDENGQLQVRLDGLRGRAIRGAGATLLSSGAGMFVQVGSAVILARILTPEDFGLVAMVTTFSLLLANIGFNGFTEGVLKADDLDHRLASNLFWINVAVGVTLSVAFALSGSLLAWFYDNSRVESVALAVSFTICFSSTWVMHSALLRRAMRFSAVSALEVIARVASVVVSISMALAGWGYWSLVGGLFCVPLITNIGVWTLCRWMPGLPGSGAGTTSMVTFALNVYGRFMVNYGARNMDNFLIGWRFGSESLGLYKKVYDLFALSAGALISPLTHVAVSALSRLSGSPSEYKRYLFGALGVIAFVGMGVGAMLTVAGADIIRVVLGPQWASAGTIFRLFGPGIGIMQLHATHGWIHLSLGRADRWFRWGIVEFCVTALLFLLMLGRGPEGIALAWTMSFWILTIPALWFAGREIRLEVRSVLAIVWRYIAASLVAGYATTVVIGALQIPAPSSSMEALTRLLLTCPLFGSLYLAAVVVLHGGWAPLYQFLRLLKEMLPSRLVARASRVVTAETSG